FITTEPGPFQQSASSLPVDGAVYLLDQNDIILDRPPRQQGILLGQIADVAPCAVGTLTINKDITTLGIDQCADEIEDGALSAAGGTEQRDELPVSDTQRKVVEHVDVRLPFECMRQIFNPQFVSHPFHFLSCPDSMGSAISRAAE